VAAAVMVDDGELAFTNAAAQEPVDQEHGGQCNGGFRRGNGGGLAIGMAT
jgi:hypothetical protein